MRIICDIETDSLKPTKIWCIVTKNVDTQEVKTFWRPDLNKQEFLSYVKDATLWIGHFFIKFDYWKVLRVFFPELKIDPLTIRDTHVISKLFNFNLGEHGLEAWGERLGIAKPKITDFNTVDRDEIINRCQQDVEINYKLWKKMEPALLTGVWENSLLLEHKMEFITLDMENNGFPFDYDETLRIRQEIEERIAEIDVQIRKDFKPKCYLIKEVTPKLTQKGTLALNDFKWIKEPTLDLTPFTAGSSFSVIGFEEFNPASTPQIIDRLNEAGWKPVDKTDGHIEAEREYKRNPRNRELKERLDRFRLRGFKINETNLATLPRDAPEGARKLAERILLSNRRSVLTEWINAYNPVSRALHGRFNGIGTWTHRMSHQAPNQGNIPSDPEVKDPSNPTQYELVQLKYGMNLRKVWRVNEGERLLGVDADGIQLRIFAHYIDDPDFTAALVSGKKEDGTDPHTLNAVKLGIGPERRSMAKTFDKIEVYKTVKFSGTLVRDNTEPSLMFQ
jgi:DNA polymerase-1